MDLITLEYKDYFDNNIEKKIQFSKNLIDSTYNIKSLFALKVDGESMQPLISHKALIVADLSQKYIENDSIYLLYKDNKMWVKKARIVGNGISFISINKDFSHLVYKKEDVYIVAKVLFTFTNL